MLLRREYRKIKYRESNPILYMHVTESIWPLLQGRKRLFFITKLWLFVLFCFICIYFILFLLTFTLLLQLHNSTSRRELCSIIIFLDRWQGWALGKDPAEGKVARSGENTFVSAVRKKEWGGFSGREVESKWNQKSGGGDNGPNCAQRRVGDGQGRMEALTGYWSTNRGKKTYSLVITAALASYLRIINPSQAISVRAQL